MCRGSSLTEISTFRGSVGVPTVQTDLANLRRECRPPFPGQQVAAAWGKSGNCSRRVLIQPGLVPCDDVRLRRSTAKSVAASSVLKFEQGVIAMNRRFWSLVFAAVAVLF